MKLLLRGIFELNVSRVERAFNRVRNVLLSRFRDSKSPIDSRNLIESTLKTDYDAAYTVPIVR